MQKILYYEISTAIKDRPKAFQVITLVLFAFSLTMILVGSISRIGAPVGNQQFVKAKAAATYAGYVSSVQPAISLKK